MKKIVAAWLLLIPSVAMSVPPTLWGGSRATLLQGGMTSKDANATLDFGTSSGSPNTYNGLTINNGVSTASNTSTTLVSAADGWVATQLYRTANTPALWSTYIPQGSTDFRIYSSTFGDVANFGYTNGGMTLKSSIDPAMTISKSGIARMNITDTGGATLELLADNTFAPFIGSKSNHALRLGANDTTRGQISAGGAWTIGSGGNFVTHIVNGVGFAYGDLTGWGSGNTIGFRWDSGTGHFIGVVDNVTGLSLANVSDYRLKEDIKDLGANESFDILKKIHPRTFRMKADEKRRLRHGFVAHEIQKALPEVVTGEKDAEKDGKPSYQSVDYGLLTPLLVTAVNELKTEVDTLKAENVKLRNEERELMQKVADLDADLNVIRVKTRAYDNDLPEYR